MANTFRAGAATTNISPRLGVSINGGMQDRQAENIHDELHVRALVLDNGGEPIALCMVDNCLIAGAILDEAKDLLHSLTSFPRDRILIAATHAHTCPTVTPIFQSEVDLDYAEFLIVRIADAIRMAWRRLAPARVAWGTVPVPQHVFNRRWKLRPGTIPLNPFDQPDQVKTNPSPASADLVEPAGPTDPDVTFLAVQGADARPLAVFANYSLHYVGGAGPQDISADYFGEFARRVAHLLGRDAADPLFVAMMSNGTSGNINNINFRVARERLPNFEQMHRVADDVARAVAQSVQQATFHESAPLAMREASLVLRRRLPTADEVAKAKFLLAQGVGLPLTKVADIYARETLLMADWPATFETTLQAVRVGGFGIVTTPCETFVETGLAIKAASPLRPTCVVSLANDYGGYLPTPEHHTLGGYETWRARSSFLEVEAEPKVRALALKLLADVARD